MMVSVFKCTLCQLWLLYFLCFNLLLVIESSPLYEEVSEDGPLTEADLEYVSKLFQRAMENRRTSRLAPLVILDPNNKQISQIRSRLRLPIIGKRIWMIKRQGFKPCVFKYCDF